MTPSDIQLYIEELLESVPCERDPIPLDIGSRLIAEGHILTDHENPEE